MNIMLDFDGTLADGPKLLREIINDKFNIDIPEANLYYADRNIISNILSITPEKVDLITDSVFHSDIMLRTELFPGAKEIILNLEKQGFNFKIVTARNTEAKATLARDWLTLNNLGHIEVISVPDGKTKADFVEGCEIAIDDLPKNLEDVSPIVPHLILFNGYNLVRETPFTEFDHWDKIYDHITNLSKFLNR